MNFVNSISAPASLVFPPQDIPRKTFCVLGVPRGGTTMIAGLLRRLGIFMDPDTNLTPHEDAGFLAHTGRRDLFTDDARREDRDLYLGQVAGLIKARNRDYAVWGWKDPIASHYIADIRHLLTGVHYIYVTRDLGAVAQRELHAEGDRFPPEHILAHLQGAASAYSFLTGYLAEEQAPTLLVSYERSIAAPRQLVAALASFAMVKSPDPELFRFIKQIR